MLSLVVPELLNDLLQLLDLLLEDVHSALRKLQVLAVLCLLRLSLLLQLVELSLVRLCVRGVNFLVSHPLVAVLYGEVEEGRSGLL